MNLLKNMLRWRRPSGSTSAEDFATTFLDTLDGVYRDGYGNRIARIGDSPILWASHFDTVHRKEGGQEVVYDAEAGVIRLAPTSDSWCLGADDTAGVWLMVRMYERGVPGMYVWHADEESGCDGSTWLTTRDEDLLDDLLVGIKAVISLDRQGTTSVITHQSSQRTCSDEFALALAERLGMGHELDPSGIFTDSLMYAPLVSECTNLSVGYEFAHTSVEVLNVGYLYELLDALSNLDQRLPFTRDPGVVEDLRWERDYEYANLPSTWDDLMELVQDYPEIVVNYLYEQGYAAADIINDQQVRS